MPIVLARVDNRLIHGQVLQAWIPRLKATTVVVAEDDVAEDNVRRAIMEIALPPEIKGVFLKIAALNDWIKHGKTSGEKVIILFADIKGLHEAVKNGLALSCANIGNVHYEEGKKKITPTVSLNDQELCMLAEIASHMAVEIRSAPDDKSIMLDDALKGVDAPDSCAIEHKGFWDKMKSKLGKKKYPKECGDISAGEHTDVSEAKTDKK